MIMYFREMSIDACRYKIHSICLRKSNAVTHSFMLYLIFVL